MYLTLITLMPLHHCHKTVLIHKWPLLLDPCEKCNNIPGGHAWHNFFMACIKLEARAIYVSKKACGNDIMACVYKLDCLTWPKIQQKTCRRI